MRRIAITLTVVSIVVLTTRAASPELTLGQLAPHAGRPVHSDFNGDGFVDLAVAAPSEFVRDIGQAGAVNVLYGSGGGLQATSPDDQFWTQDSPGVKDEAEVGDEFGRSIAAGDFNGDGFADLAVGALEKVGNKQDAGAVSVLYGSAGGLQATSPDDQFWTQDSQGVKDIADFGDFFASSLATGDFNGDGFADLSVGAGLEGINDEAFAGAVNTLYGSAAGLQAESPDDQFWSQDSLGVKGVAEWDDNFGDALAASDFNRDGFADLAVGVYSEDSGDVLAVGAVNVLYGSPGGLQTHSPDDQFWAQDSPGVKDDAELSDGFGQSVAAGDFNGDGFADLAVGAPSDANAGGGAVNVLYGWIGGLQATAPDDQFWTQDSPGVKGAGDGGEQFGRHLAVGEFNGDGFTDLAVGSFSEDKGPQSGVGAANVLYGSAGGLQAISPDDQYWGQDSAGVKERAEEHDGFGSSVAAGDFNADGFTDLALGVPSESVVDVFRAGAVNVLYGSAGGLQTHSPDDQFWAQDSPGMKDLADDYEFFGESLAAGG